MANGIKDKNVLIMGCGPVGESAARKLLSFNARVSLVDKDYNTAVSLGNRLWGVDKKNKSKIERIENIDYSTYGFVIEATPSENTIPDSQLSGHMAVAAPGVPLGISATGINILKDCLVHDKLELGVAAMAVSLLK